MFSAWRKKGNEWRCRAPTCAGTNGWRFAQVACMWRACGARSCKDDGIQAMKTKLLRRAGAFLLLAVSLAGARAESPDASDDFDMTAANLMVVLRESPGVNKQDESL